ncbi:MAG: ABC transporter ATP-binding protein [Peptococcaceae bacterium]|nr:ABC transporter ATP-binding protein [Peptococcaceae bacterium]
MDMLRVDGVTKRFGSRTVVENLSFSAPEHAIVGFVGRNGAGKTTTMKMILGLLAPDAGSITVAGERVRYGAARTNRLIGYLPDVPAFYSYMSAQEYLTLCGRIKGMAPRILKGEVEVLLARVGLACDKKRIGGYSRGMKQRLGVAQALLGAPPLLIFDEPTSALDPMGRKDILDILQAVTTETTVVFSTHVLSDVARVCDHIVVLSDGHVALSGKKSDLLTAQGGDKLLVEFASVEEAARFSAQYPAAVCDAASVTLSEKSCGGMNALLAQLGAANFTVTRVERQAASLEDVFIKAVGA